MMTVKSRIIHGVGFCILMAAAGVTSATAQQPGAAEQQGGQPMAPQPGTAPAKPAPPFVLDAQQQAFVDQVLADWEAHTAKIKTFRCEFTRWEYQPDFVPATHPQFKEHPGVQSDGELRYSAPDKGSFQVNKIRRLNLENGEYDVAKDEVGEHWVSTGEAIYEYDAKQKVVLKRTIPPEMRGRAISDGPLPFLFGAEAAKLKRRYFLRIVTPTEFAATEIWVDAFPRFRGDAANFKRSILRLKKESFEPFAMRLYDPGNGFTSYEFRNVVINDKLAPIREFFAPPRVPFGWKLKVEEDSAPPQQPATPVPPTAGRPNGFQPR